MSFRENPTSPLEHLYLKKQSLSQSIDENIKDKTSHESTPYREETPVSDKPNSLHVSQTQSKKTARACIRCRFRHTRCPGGSPCSKCQMAKTKCEYVEYEKRLVVSRKYIYKLQEDIAKLKKENACLRNYLKEERLKSIHMQEKSTKSFLPGNTETELFQHSPFSSSGAEPDLMSMSTEALGSSSEIIHPSLDKYGRLIQSQTGEKLYVGSSSMTLFGLEIQNMAHIHPNPHFDSPHIESSISTSSKTINDQLHVSSTASESYIDRKRESRILEKEGNAYNITLAKTNTRPGLSVNFTLPSYAYAILLVDTFINYNDGCFYFFNEGLVKKYLMNLYSGKNENNKKIIKRNISASVHPSDDENSIKKDTDDDTILETIWFCKILLIFAIGEMYLGTESDTHIRNSKQESMNAFAKKRRKKKADYDGNTLPGSGFFCQASELFTGLFASGAIDNITKDGGIEVMLLYAFYLQVADCTIASYFYFGLALRSTLILGWHVDADKENLNRFELEHRRRIWWTVYMYERMLSSKAGLPLSFADDSVSTELPCDFNVDLTHLVKDENDVRASYIYPSAEYINNCVTITQINAIILSSLYTKQPTANILPVVSDLVQRLFKWKNALPTFLKVDFTSTYPTITRLTVNLMTEYFQGMNLAVRPLLFHFATKKLKEVQSALHESKYIDLSKYSKNVLTLLNASFQASINTIKCIWALVPQNMVALFGWMDREYLFTSASTLILFNASFGVHDATRDHLDHALSIFTRMKKLGNYPAALRRAQLLKLIRVLDFNGIMYDLLQKHDYGAEPSPTHPPTTGFDKNEVSRHSIDTAFAQSGTNYTSPVAPEPLRSDLDFIQFNGPVPSATRPTSNRHTPTIAASENLTIETSYQPDFETKLNGDVYSNSDLAGIEGVIYLDEEQKMWNEITNDAGWLQPTGMNANQYPLGLDQKAGIIGEESNIHKTPSKDNSYNPNYSMGNFVGAYSDIINSEFHSSEF